MTVREAVARELALIACDDFALGRNYWLLSADRVLAIATAARQGGDVQQAPAESPQSGGAKTPHRPEQSA